MRLLLLPLLPLIGLKTSAEVKSQTQQGFFLTHQIVLPVDDARAWAGLVEEVHRWWSSSHTWWGDSQALSISLGPGGCFCEQSQGHIAEHMRITQVDPKRLLRMTGGLGPLQALALSGTMDWQFSEHNGGTRLSLKYRVNGHYEGDYARLARAVDKVLGEQLASYQQYLNPPPCGHGE